jgi:Leucine-rich repeat (LRR) protein
LTISNGALGNITRLDYLDLSNIITLEYMDHSGCKKVNELTSGIGDLYNLETLALGSDLLKVLPVSVGFLESLTDLSLHDLPILKCLPESIGLLTKLKKLHLWKCGIEYLPQNLMKLNNLEILRVDECPLLEFPFKKVEREMDRLLLFDNLDSSSDQCMLGLKELWLHCTKISEVAFPKGVCLKPSSSVLGLV